MALEQFQRPLKKKLTLVTSCSGTGAPTFWFKVRCSFLGSFFRNVEIRLIYFYVIQRAQKMRRRSGEGSHFLETIRETESKLVIFEWCDRLPAQNFKAILAVIAKLAGRTSFAKNASMYDAGFQDIPGRMHASEHLREKIWIGLATVMGLVHVQKVLREELTEVEMQSVTFQVRSNTIDMLNHFKNNMLTTFQRISMCVSSSLGTFFTALSSPCPVSSSFISIVISIIRHRDQSRIKIQVSFGDFGYDSSQYGLQFTSSSIIFNRLNDSAQHPMHFSKIGFRSRAPSEGHNHREEFRRK